MKPSDIRTRLGLLILLGIVGLYAACQTTSATDSATAPPCCKDVVDWAPHVDTYIGLDAVWNEHVRKAICQLEESTRALLDDAALTDPPTWDETLLICEPDTDPKRPPEDSCDFGACEA